MRKVVAVLWPSFLFAGLGTVLFFAFIDPVDMIFVGPLELGQKAAYAFGFFFFWALAAGSSWLTCVLAPGTSDAAR